MTYTNTTTQAASDPQEVEVAAPATRRQHTQAYKRRVINDTEKLTPTERGSYLRKEGLYFSQLSRGRREVGKAPLESQRGSESRPATKEESAEIRTLKRQLEQAQNKLRKANVMLDFQKKTLALLESLEDPTS